MTYRRTRIPAIHAARRLAPTDWNRRPIAVERRINATSNVNTTTNQNVLLMPMNRSIMKSDSASGTCDSLAVPSRYSAVMPSRISPVDSVTMSGLRSKIAISNPFTRPITNGPGEHDEDRVREAVVGPLGDTDEDVGEQRDRTRHRQVDPAHHDHEHLPEGDDGDDAADRQEDRPRR